MQVILYTTHCPQCKVLETKLKNKDISYTEVTDVNIMRQKGFMSVPYLEVDSQVFSFSEAVTWVNNYQEA